MARSLGAMSTPCRSGGQRRLGRGGEACWDWGVGQGSALAPSNTAAVPHPEGVADLVFFFFFIPEKLINRFDSGETGKYRIVGSRENVRSIVLEIQESLDVAITIDQAIHAVDANEMYDGQRRNSGRR